MIARATRLTSLLLAIGAAAPFGERAASCIEPAGIYCAPAAIDDRGQAPALKIAWKLSGDAKSTKAVVQVSGLDASVLSLLKSPRMTASRWPFFFSVRVVSDEKIRESKADPTPPLWGSYEVDDNLIRFVPRFPAERGIRYRAAFDPSALQAVVKELGGDGQVAAGESANRPVEADLFLHPSVAAPSTRVAAVYPSGDRLPENLLRFYIHFSAPMSRGEAYRHLKLIETASGKPVHAPFLELEEELWSPDGRRFTLFIDPGRIKRGLKPREMFGPVLESGKEYRLVIDSGWSDAEGHALKSEFRRTFRAGPPDESMPDPRKWTVIPPTVGTSNALEVRFGEPLDRALVQRLVRVEDPARQAVTGRVSVAAGETLWRFTPDAPWRDGSYRLLIGMELEDVAGNSVAAPFEVDLTAPITTRVPTNQVVVPFSPTTANGGSPQASAPSP